MPWHLSCVYGRADNSRNYIVWRFLYFIYSFLNDLGLELFQVCICTELLNAQEFLQLNQVLHQSWNIHTLRLASFHLSLCCLKKQTDPQQQPPVLALSTFTPLWGHPGQRLRCLQVTGKALVTHCGNHHS